MFKPQTKKLLVVSYVIIFAFHLDLKLERVIIECSFGHSLEKLTIDYLTRDHMTFTNQKTLLL